jgi:MFS family permease
MKQLFLLAFLNESGRDPVSIYLPLFLIEKFNSPYILVGLALTLSTSASALFQMIGGILADSLGRRRTILLSVGVRILTLSGLTIISISAVGSALVAFLALYILTEAFNGLFQTATSTMVADLVEPRKRVEAYGIYHISINVAFTLGALLGGLPIAFPLLFVFWLFCMIADVLIVVPYLKESWRGSGTRFSPRSLLGGVKDRYLLAFGLVTLGAGLVANQMGPTLVLYATGSLGVTRDQLGILYTLNGVLVILLQYPISRLLLRYSYSKTLAVASALRAAGFLMIAGLSGFGWLQVVIVALTLGETLQTPAGASYAAVLATETNRGEYLGFYNWMWNSGMALSPFVGSYLLSILAPSAFRAWYVIFLIGVACSGVYVWLGNMTKRRLPKLAGVL